MALLWVLRTIFNSKASPGGRKGSNVEVVVRRIARDRSRSGESTRGAQQAWTPGVSPWQQLSVGLPTGPGMEWGKRVFTEGRVTTSLPCFLHPNPETLRESRAKYQPTPCSRHQNTRQKDFLIRAKKMAQSVKCLYMRIFTWISDIYVKSWVWQWISVIIALRGQKHMDFWPD